MQPQATIVKNANLFELCEYAYAMGVDIDRQLFAQYHYNRLQAVETVLVRDVDPSTRKPTFDILTQEEFLAKYNLDEAPSNLPVRQTV